MEFDFLRDAKPELLEINFVTFVFSGSLHSRPSFSSSGMILNLKVTRERSIH